MAVYHLYIRLQHSYTVDTTSTLDKWTLSFLVSCLSFVKNLLWILDMLTKEFFSLLTRSDFLSHGDQLWPSDGLTVHTLAESQEVPGDGALDKCSRNTHRHFPDYVWGTATVKNKKTINMHFQNISDEPNNSDSPTMSKECLNCPKYTGLILGGNTGRTLVPVLQRRVHSLHKLSQAWTPKIAPNVAPVFTMTWLGWVWALQNSVNVPAISTTPLAAW